MNEVFYEFIPVPDSPALTIALHYLGAVNEQTVLYETLVDVRGEKKTEEIIVEIAKTLETAGDIKLMKGKIREIFLSLS